MPWPTASSSASVKEMAFAAETVLTGAASDVTLTIPSGQGRFVNCYILCSWATDAQIIIEINGVSSADYHYQQYKTLGAAISSTRVTAASSWKLMDSDIDATIPMMVVMELTGGNDMIKGHAQIWCIAGATAGMLQSVVELASAGPITSINIDSVGDNLETDSIFLAEGVGND